MTSIKRRAAEEQTRITDILTNHGVSQNRMNALEPVIVNTAWMKAKLDDTRTAIKNGKIVVEYDNGGGQKGTRENPLFRGYEALWKSYMAGMKMILDALGEDEARAEKARAAEPRTVLELVKARRAKEG